MERNPFDVLNLPADAGLEAAKASYRALARKHHPDSAPEREKDRATKAMAELNWAMEELERDLEGWRRYADDPLAGIISFEQERPEQPITVEPRLVILDQKNNFTAWITAAGRGVTSEDLKLRYASGLILVERASPLSGVTNFRVRLAPGVTELAQEQSETVEIRAPWSAPVSVRVAVAPFTTADSMQWLRDYREPFRYTRELIVAGAAFLGALGVLLLVI